MLAQQKSDSKQYGQEEKGGQIQKRITEKGKYDQNTVYEILKEVMFTLRINLVMKTEKKTNIYKKQVINNQNQVISPAKKEDNSKLMLTRSEIGNLR